MDYATWINVTQSIQFLIIIGVVWFFIGIFLYLIIAGNIKARVNGRKLNRSMLSSRNAWLVPLLIWVLQAGVILIGFIFPFWLKWFFPITI